MPRTRRPYLAEVGAGSWSWCATDNYSTSASPATGCANGTPIFVGAAGQFEHQNLVAGTRYFYRLCATDKGGNVSMGAVGFAVAR